MEIEYIVPLYISEKIVTKLLARIYGMPIMINHENEVLINESEVSLLKVLFHKCGVVKERIELTLENGNFLCENMSIKIYNIYQKEVAKIFIEYNSDRTARFKLCSYMYTYENQETIFGIIELCKILGGNIKINEINIEIEKNNAVYQPWNKSTPQEKKEHFFEVLKNIEIINEKKLESYIKTYPEIFNDNLFKHLLDMQSFRVKESLMSEIVKTNKSEKLMKF